MLAAGRHPLMEGLPERWAAAWGEDGFGLFASFFVQETAQRMRWIPSAKFVMGSPNGEAGRQEGDSPQHTVEITRGFWLADTPCTQALWSAVMGTNPSWFVTPDRPVELVTWYDCQDFAARLNARVPGLGVRLPTEAEWEHACRAGTTTTTWLGDLDIRGSYDAPQLDAIAWYGGNSGEGFELQNGAQSSGWPEKQYLHTRAGTRPVAKKKMNPFGLFDMLGNVFEWCEDWYGVYPAAPVVDPRGPDSGSYRVMRGGSWDSDARGLRAAGRFASGPRSRGQTLGFRLARSQGTDPAADPGARTRSRTLR